MELSCDQFNFDEESVDCRKCVMLYFCRRKSHTKLYKSRRKVGPLMENTCFGQFEKDNTLCRICSEREECQLVKDYLEKGGNMNELQKQDISALKGKKILDVVPLEKAKPDPRRSEAYEQRPIGGKGRTKLEDKIQEKPLEDKQVEDKVKSDEPLQAPKKKAMSETIPEKTNIYQKRFRELENPYSENDPKKKRFADKKNPWSLDGRMGQVFEDWKKNSRVFSGIKTGDKIAEKILQEGLECGFIEKVRIENEIRYQIVVM